MNNYQNWDDLGRAIRDEVDRAVNSQDFQNMARNIRQAVEAAADAGGEAVRRASQTVKQRSVSPAKVTHLYGKTGGKVIGGILASFFGGLFTLASSIVAIVMLCTQLWLGVKISGGLLLPSALLLAAGVRNLTTVSRFRAYRRILGQKTQCAIEKLARTVGKDAAFVRKDVQRMIGKGYFPEGHLDHEQNHLIISDETYRRFEQARLQLEATRKQQAAEAANAPDPRIQEVLDKGSAFIARIRKCNDDIPGQVVSEKIDRIELLVRKIFDRARSNPEIIPDLKKLMDYYLPMTVKLLTAYADMDAQPVQGENILSSKREIEATLDTLDQAFRKLLDELYQETALDISSDISVLNAMLAREGLAEDELTKMRNQRNFES